MAVIITNVDMSESCLKCSFRAEVSRCYVSHYRPIDCHIMGGEKPDWCPLKSADKMIAEIEYHRNKTAPIDKYDLVGDCIDIIHKYCDKENENDK